MASEIGLKLVVGAALAGTFHTVLGGAKRSVAELGAVADRLQSRHERLGMVMAKAMAHPARSVADLRRRYEALGVTLDQVRRQSEALSRSMAQGEALKEARDGRLAAMRETAGASVAVGAPVIKAMSDTATFGDAVKDIAITGELSRDAERRLGASLRSVAVSVNQSAVDMARGVGLLIANGMEADKAASQADLLGRFTTATRANFEDAASMMVSFDRLGVSAQDMAMAFSQAAKAGKLGSFEVRDMAKWFPQIGGYLKAVGVTGNEAVINMASRLQIAMKTAGSTDEAANNFRNFLSKLTSPDTAKDFEKLGIDLQGSMLRMARQGLDPIEGAVGVIMDKMRQQSPAVAAELQALSKELSSIQDPARRAAELERRRAMIESLGQQAGLGRMFQDMQAMSYLMAELQNRDELKRIQRETASGRATDGRMALDVDFAKRLESPLEQLKSLKIQLTEMGMSIGEALLPPLLSIVEAVKPVVKSVSEWMQANPVLTKTVVGLAMAMTAGKLAVMGVGWAVNFMLLSPLNSLRTAILAVGGKWLWLKGLWQSGAFVPALRGISRVAGRALSLAGVLGGALRTGVMVAGRAVLWLGRALLLNPIGLTLTAIAGAAYLVWRNWDKIGPSLGRVWQHVRSGFSAAWSWLNGLPGQMLTLGGEIVSGLIQGIRNNLARAGAAIEQLGESIKSRFKGWLGIHSPSRVFAGFGQMIGLGAAEGIAGMAGVVGKATAGLAIAATTAFQPALAADVPALHATKSGLGHHVVELPEMPNPARSADRGSMAAHGAATITFAPTIHVASAGGNPAAVREQVTQAVQMSFSEFERLMRRYEAERRRVSPMGGMS